MKIEWNWDFDNLWHEFKSIGSGDNKYEFGEDGRFRFKGRCTRCWGRLVGKRGEEGVPTAIRCRVCGILLEGDEANRHRALHRLQACPGATRMHVGDLTNCACGSRSNIAVSIKNA